MKDDVVHVSVDQEVLLLGRGGALSRIPLALREPRRVQTLLPRLANTAAMRAVRMYWADHSSAHGLADLSDHDVLRLVGAAIQDGRLQAMTFPHVIPDHVLERSPACRSALAASVPPGVAPPTTARPRSVAQWPLEDRVADVIRRAVPKVPGDVGATLLSLLTPESLAIVVGTIVFSVAANLTPYGWVADGVILGITFGFGGLAAIHALGDLVECFKLTSGAKSPQDLDAAADALARAVVGLGVVALMVLLHRLGTETKDGAGRIKVDDTAQQATREEMATARAARLRARLERQQANARAEQEAAAQTRPTSLREKYLGRTPGKSSRTGREVIARMEEEGRIRTNPRTGAQEFQSSKDQQWYDVSDADMAHKTDAVTWWNNTGRAYGAKSPEVRAWMLDSNNYELEHYSINRSEGATLGQTQNYLPPLR
jgi:hypothetical protein